MHRAAMCEAVEPERKHQRRQNDRDDSQLRMDVRLEAFNLFNRTIWGAPVSTDFNNNN